MVSLDEALQGAQRDGQQIRCSGSHGHLGLPKGDIVSRMGSFDIWQNFGFLENPYSQTTLKADAVGNELLAGRDTEIRVLQKRIGSTGAHPSVEGPIGAGS